MPTGSLRSRIFRKGWHFQRVGRGVEALALLAFFGLALLVSTVAHANTNWGRRLVAGSIESLLDDELEGHFELSIERVGVRGVRLGKFVARSPSGVEVIAAERIRVSIGVLTTLQRLVLDSGEISVVVDHVRIGSAHVSLAREPQSSQLELVRAFEVKPSPRPSAASPAVRIHLLQIELGHAWTSLPWQDDGFRVDVAAVRGSLFAGSIQTLINVERFALSASAGPKRQARGTGTFSFRTPQELWASFDGFVDNVQTGLTAHLEGGVVGLGVELPSIRPEDARRLFDDWPLTVPAALSATAEGNFEELDVAAAVDLSRHGKLALSGAVKLEPLSLALSGVAHHVDLRSIAAPSPKTALEASYSVEVHEAKDGLRGALQLKTEPSSVRGLALPSVAAEAQLDATGIRGRAHVAEPGMPLDVEFDWPLGKGLDFKLEVPWFELSGAKRLRGLVAATGRARLTARGALLGSDLQTELSFDAERLSLLGLSAQRVAAHGSLAGAVDAWPVWQVDGSLDAHQLWFKPLDVERATVEAKGALLSPRVRVSVADGRGTTLVAAASLDLEDTPLEAREVELEVERGPQRVQGKVDRIRWGASQLVVNELAVGGDAGELRGSLDWEPTALSASAVGAGLDLGAITEIAGLPRGWLGGKLTLDAAVQTGSERPQQGIVRLGLVDGEFAHVTGIELDLDATIQQERASGSASLELKGWGVASAAWEGALAGPLLAAESWVDATANAQLNLSYVELAAFEPLLPASGPVHDLGGRGFVQLRVERNEHGAAPRIYVVGATRDLRATLRGQGAEGSSDSAAARPAPRAQSSQASASATTPEPAGGLSIRGGDLNFGAEIDGRKGDVSAHLQLLDGLGPLASATVATQVDWESVLERPSLQAPWFQAMALDAVVVVPERPTTELQPFLPFVLPAQRASARATLHGTLTAPRVGAQLSLLGLVIPDARGEVPLDLTARAELDSATGELAAHGEVRQGNLRRATFNGQGTLVPSNSDTVPSWIGQALVSIDGLPLDLMGPLADEDITGLVRGKIALERRQLLPSLVADLQVEGAAVDLLPLGDGRLSVRSDGQVINSRLGFLNGTGSLELRMIAALDWLDALPRLRDGQPVQLELDAKSYDAVVLKPVISDVVSELRGKIDAELSLSLEQVPSKSDPNSWSWGGSLRGTSSLREGAIQLKALGIELGSVRLDATTRQIGNLTAVVIDGIQARVRSEKPNLDANAVLYLDGFDLVRADASARLVDVPLAIEGVSQASATGTLFTSLERKPRLMHVTVSVPDLVATLPRKTNRTVLPLDRPSSITVLQPLSKPREARSDDALPWKIEFDLGERVRVQRNDLHVGLQGDPYVLLGRETQVGGSLRLSPGGRFTLLGKSFEVDEGTVRFDNDSPSNPSIDITALWRGASHLVTVQLLGKARDARLILRSDPPLPENEVFALLLGGTPGEGGSAASTGAGVGASLLNDLLADTPLGNIDLRASTEAERANYTAAVRISDKVWFEATYLSPEGNSQSGPGAADSSSGFSGTVDWRFRQDWSLRTEVGTIGGGFDLLWQYRY